MPIGFPVLDEKRYRSERANDFADKVREDASTFAQWVAEGLDDDESDSVIGSFGYTLDGLASVIDVLAVMAEELRVLGGNGFEDAFDGNPDGLRCLARYLDRCALTLEVQADGIGDGVGCLLSSAVERIEEW